MDAKLWVPEYDAPELWHKEISRRCFVKSGISGFLGSSRCSISARVALRSLKILCRAPNAGSCCARPEELLALVDPAFAMLLKELAERDLLEETIVL